MENYVDALCFFTHHFLDSSVVPIVDVQQTTDRPLRLDYSKLWVSARCSFQWAALSYGFVLGLGFGNVADVGGVAGKGRVETVADVRFVLDATAAFFHGLYLFGTLALLEAAVLEACLDGARFELAQVTSAGRHQSQKRSPIPSPTLVGPQLRTQSLPRLYSRATQTNKKVKKGQQEILTRLTNAKARVFGNWKL